MEPPALLLKTGVFINRVWNVWPRHWFHVALAVATNFQLIQSRAGQASQRDTVRHLELVEAHMSERGPVGGAGELTMLSEGEVRTIIYDALKNQFPAEGAAIMVAGCCAKPVLDALKAALAAKAPQGVPTDSALCPECRSTDNHPYVTYDGVAMRACGRCMIEWRDDTAPRLPVPGPVSDDTIHHGPFPPATRSDTEPVPSCVDCGKPWTFWHKCEAAAPKPAPPSDEQVRKEFHDREYRAQEMLNVATPAPGAERAQLHPNRKTVITHDQARAALQHFVNRHFNNPGEKSRASIPAHQDDDDILLFDYITQREALAAAPPAPQPIETLVHQLTKVTMELEDTLASLGKADSMITKLKDLIAERDRHASAERLPLNQRMWDLLRTQRAPLLTDELITEDEYAELAKDHPAVKRLEDYDAVRHASAERVRQAFEHEIYHNYDEPLTSKEIMKAFDAAVKTLTRALPPSTGEKAQ